MSAPEVERRFLSVVTGWLLSLPHDLKVLFEAKDDPNLDRPARETAAGAILHALLPDTSGEEKFITFADDAILVHAALRAILQQGGEAAADFKTRFDEYYVDLDSNLAVCQQAMGDTYAWLAAKVEALPKQSYKGKKVPVYIDDDEADRAAVRGQPGLRDRLPGGREQARDARQAPRDLARAAPPDGRRG